MTSARLAPPLLRRLGGGLAQCRSTVADWTRARLGRGPTPRVQPLLADLQEQERALAEVWTQVEQNFLAVGSELDAQVAQSRELLQCGEQLVALAASEHNPMQEAAHLVKDTLAFIDRCREHIDVLVASLERYHEQTGRLLQEERKVERILAPLRIIQTLFRIEATALPAEAQMAFGTVASEIPRFEHAVREAFDHHAEALTSTRRAIEVTTAHLRETRARQQREADTRRESIDASLREIEADLAGSRERDARLAEHLAGIDRETTGIVVNLQYQDITRQKMEHVRQALADLESRLGGSEGTAVSQLEYVRATCELQALQTAAVDQELQEAVGRIAADLQRIFGRLQQIEQECWSRSEVGTVTRAVEARVTNLCQAVVAVQALVPLAMAGAAEVVQVVSSFGTVAADVAATARDMAESMRLIALNAQVLAAQAGEHGAGLLILAERTYEISQEIRSVTDVIGSEFSAAAEQRAAVVADAEALNRLTAEQHAALAARCDPIKRNLDAHVQQSMTLLSRLGELLEATHCRLRGMEEHLAFAVPCGERLGALRSRLEAVAAACPGAPRDSAVASGVAAILAQQKQRYTTDAERTMHELAVAEAVPAARERRETPPASAPGPVVAEASRSTSPHGDNVELF